MERPKISATLTKVSLGDQWQMFLNKEPDLLIDEKPFLALTMLYHPVTREFVSRALGRLVESGQVQSETEFLAKSLQFFQCEKPCLGMKPRDDNFPLSCQFSPNCSIMISKTSKSKTCLACLQCLEEPIQIWQDPIEATLDSYSKQGSDTDEVSPDYPEHSQSIEESASNIINIEHHNEKDPLADESVVEDPELQSILPKLEPNENCSTLNSEKTTSIDALESPKKAIPPESIQSKADPQSAILFKIKYGPINTEKSFSNSIKTMCLQCKRLVPLNLITKHNMFRHQMGEFQCPQCPQVFQKAKHIIFHIKLHPDVTKIKCPNCQQDVNLGSNGEDLLNHMATCHKIKFLWDEESNQLKPFIGKICMDCLGSFQTEQELQEHEVENVCTKSTHRPVTNHKYKRNSDNTITCLKCNKEFLSMRSLKNHDNLNHYEQILVCDHCGMQFTNEISFQKHQNRKHPKSDKLKCKECGFYAGTEAQLRAHKVIHEERKHLCTTCGKRFVQSGHLLIHLRSHTGEKPFMCESCDYSTATSGNLVSHKKHVHGKEARKKYYKKRKKTN